MKYITVNDIHRQMTRLKSS